MFEILGAGGIVISALAYLPQAIHLAREHCSAGISSRAWAMWLTSSVLVGALAVHRGDMVFILLQVSTLASASVIVFLAHKYRGMVCEVHAHLAPAPHDRRRFAAKQRVNLASGALLQPVAEEQMVPVRPNPEQATPQRV
jgi:uncharacterized protein with PQ loop repeat